MSGNQKSSQLISPSRMGSFVYFSAPGVTPRQSNNGLQRTRLRRAAEGRRYNARRNEVGGNRGSASKPSERRKSYTTRKEPTRAVNSATSNNRKRTLEKALKELPTTKKRQTRTIATSISSIDVNAKVQEKLARYNKCLQSDAATPRR